MIAHDGVESQSLFNRIKSEPRPKPQGGDRDQVKAIKEGVLDYSRHILLRQNGR